MTSDGKSNESSIPYLEEVSRIVCRRFHDGDLVPHNGLEGPLEGRAAVLVVDVEAGQVAGLARTPVAVGQRALLR